MKSVCIPKCGNGIRDQDSEECDDGNRFGKDGCSNECKVEEKYECNRKDEDSRDICYRQPIASIDSISSSNEVVVIFSE